MQSGKTAFQLFWYDDSQVEQGIFHRQSLPANSFPSLVGQSVMKLNDYSGYGCNCKAKDLKFYNGLFVDEESYITNVIANAAELGKLFITDHIEMLLT